MQSADFLEFAAFLAAQNRSEAARRTAVSRPYYGAFHLAREFFSELGVKVPANATGHEFVMRRLENSGCSEARDAGSLLSDLRAERNRADYDLIDRRFERIESVKPVIESAAEFQRKLVLIASEPIRTTIRDGIAQYHKAIRYSD